MISVIIPVFNVAEYLSRCMASIISQSFQDWECILIDDGSTDGSGILCDRWAEKDPRITVLHQQNAGVSSARNRGINLAKGEYIAFVDSDDTLEPSYLSMLFNAVSALRADLIVCGMETIYQDGSMKVSSPTTSGFFTLDSNHISDLLDLERATLLYGPVVKLFRKRIITDQHLLFDETQDYGEDLLFNLSYLRFSGSIVRVPQALYHYYRRENTLSTVFRTDCFKVDYNQWKALRSFHEETGLMNEEVMRYLSQRLWGIIYDALFAFPKHPDASLSYLKRVLSVPEIDTLCQYEDVFRCASWIKRRILRRKAIWFYFFFKGFYKQ